MILALDISLNTGWALGAAGCNAFGTRVFSGLNGDDIRVGRRFKAWVDSMLDEHKPEALALERPFYKHRGPSFLLIGLNWEAQRSAEERGIARVEYSVQSIKSHLAGDARADKPAMVKAARLRGYNVGTDHEADAIGILLLHQHKTRPIDEPAPTLF